MHKEYYDFLKDEKELFWFYKHCVFEPKINEVFCFALSARNKKLSEDERKEYKLGRAEMLNTNIISLRNNEPLTFETWKKGVLKFEINKRGMVTKSGKPYPENSTVIYYYIHTSDETKVLAEGSKHIAEINQELINSAIKGSKEGINDNLKKLKGALVNIERMHARFPGTKKFVDFDMDIEPCYIDNFKDDIILDDLKLCLNSFFGKSNYFIIDTSGGFHVLVKKEVIKGNPKEFITGTCRMIEADIPVTKKIHDEKGYNIPIIKEFNINKNGLIPLPGTAQYGRTVKIVNKEDFNAD